MRHNLLAAAVPLPTIRGIGPAGLEGELSLTSGVTFSSVLSVVVGLFTVVAILWFMIQIFVAAYDIIGSNGDSKKSQSGAQRITNSVIGLIIVVSATFLLSFIGKVLKIPFLENLEITTLIKDLTDVFP